MDRIIIPGMPLTARIGVTAEEQAEEQELILSLVLHLDLATAGASDALSDTVDYDAVCRTVAGVVGHGPHRLIEAVAEGVAKAVLRGFAIDRVEVRVEKPGALRRHGVAFAAVEITRPGDG